MNKKILSLLLAVLVAFSAVAVSAFAADDADEGSTSYNYLYGLADSDYLIVPDDDYCSVKKMSYGNPAKGGEATIIPAGATVAILAKDQVTVSYYPDADSVKNTDHVRLINGAWIATNANVSAFSTSGKSVFTDTVKSFKGVYTVKGIGDTITNNTVDYTINLDGVTPEAKESGEIFLGWAVADYTSSPTGQATIVFYGVWDKDPDFAGTSDVEDPGDPIEFILDYYLGFINSIRCRIWEFVRGQLNLLAQHIHDVYNSING